MQPYFYPYVGYFQLIEACEGFVVYDDVNFIKGGWIHRNRILIGGNPHYLGVQMQDASPNKKIIEISLNESAQWREKLLKTVRQSYTKAPFVQDVIRLLEGVLFSDTSALAKISLRSIQSVLEYLEMDVEIVESSCIYQNANLSGQARVIDICKQNKADHYRNMIGGRGLYQSSALMDNGISLWFLEPDLRPYSQLTQNFVPGLSIIDALMFNDVQTCHNLLKRPSLAMS
jgi:hypothetical protein